MAQCLLAKILIKGSVNKYIFVLFIPICILLLQIYAYVMFLEAVRENMMELEISKSQTFNILQYQEDSGAVQDDKFIYIFRFMTLNNNRLNNLYLYLCF